MRLKNLLSLSLGLSLILSTAFAQTDGPAAREVLRAGVILPLSGDAAMIGQAMREGMELSAKNKALQLIFEDDRTADNKSAVAAAQKLLAVDGVHVLFNSVVNTARAIAPIITKTKTPTIVVWDSNELLLSLSPYLYSTGVSTEAAGKSGANYAIAKLHAKRAAVVTLNDEWSQIVARSFKESFVEKGGKIVQEDTINMDDNDILPVITRIRSSNPDIICFPLFGQSRLTFLRKAAELKIQSALFTADLFPEEVLQGKEYLEGVLSSQTVLRDSSFEEMYRQTFKHEVPEGMLGMVALGYDAGALIAKVADDLAAQKLEPSRDNIQKKLRQLSFAGKISKVDFSVSRMSSTEPQLMVFRAGALKQAL